MQKQKKKFRVFVNGVNDAGVKFDASRYSPRLPVGSRNFLEDRGELKAIASADDARAAGRPGRIGGRHNDRGVDHRLRRTRPARAGFQTHDEDHKSFVETELERLHAERRELQLRGALSLSTSSSSGPRGVTTIPN
jgi:hypothetical protein